MNDNKYVKFYHDDMFLEDYFKTMTLRSKKKVTMNVLYIGFDGEQKIKYRKQCHMTVAYFAGYHGFYTNPCKLYIYDFIMPYEDLVVGKEYTIVKSKTNKNYASCILDTEEYEKYDAIEKEYRNNKAMIDDFRDMDFDIACERYENALRDLYNTKKELRSEVKSKCKRDKEMESIKTDDPEDEEKDIKMLDLEPELSGGDKDDED